MVKDIAKVLPYFVGAAAIGFGSYYLYKKLKKPAPGVPPGIPPPTGAPEGLPPEGLPPSYPEGGYPEDTTPAGSYPGEGAQPSPPPEYPKTISRGSYRFTARNQTEERYLKDFLGIQPPGVDLDTYLSRMTTTTQINQWENYWVNVWTRLGRSDLISFTRSKANYYRSKLASKVIKASIVHFNASPSTINKDSSTTIRTMVKNKGNVRHTFGVGLSAKSPATGKIYDFPVKSITLDPGRYGTVSWKVTFHSRGIWKVISAVWKESSPPLRTRLDDTGWVNLVRVV